MSLVKTLQAKLADEVNLRLKAERNFSNLQSET
jgi:hypothetical protein